MRRTPRRMSGGPKVRPYVLFFRLGGKRKHVWRRSLLRTAEEYFHKGKTKVLMVRRNLPAAARLRIKQQSRPLHNKTERAWPEYLPLICIRSTPPAVHVGRINTREIWATREKSRGDPTGTDGRGDREAFENPGKKKKFFFPSRRLMDNREKAPRKAYKYKIRQESSRGSPMQFFLAVVRNNRRESRTYVWQLTLGRKTVGYDRMQTTKDMGRSDQAVPAPEKRFSYVKKNTKSSSKRTKTYSF